MLQKSGRKQQIPAVDWTQNKFENNWIKTSPPQCPFLKDFIADHLFKARHTDGTNPPPRCKLYKCSVQIIYCNK